MSKLYNLLSRGTPGLHGAALTLGVFTLVSQILALFRDRLFAHIFGASTSLDIYYSAFRIPDLLFIIVGAVVSTSVAVPLLAQAKAKSKEELERTLNMLFTFFVIVVSVLIALAFVLMPLLVSFFFPGFEGASLREITSLSRIMLLSPLLLGLSSLYSSIIQVERRFTIYSLSPILYNLGIIIGILALYPSFGLIGLGYGVAFGALLHMAIQVPYLMSAGFFPKFTRISFKRIIETVVSPSIPRTLSLTLTQILFILMVGVASRLGEGSIGVLSLAYNLQSVPVSLIGVSYSLSAFSLLAAAHAAGDAKTFGRELEQSLSWILFLAVPLSVFAIIFSADIVTLLFGTGAFTEMAQARTAQTFSFFLLSVLFQSISLLLTRTLYALGHTWRAFIPNFIGFLVSGFLIVLWFTDSIGVRSESSLALAFSVGACITAIGLFLQCARMATFNVVLLGRKFVAILGVWLFAGIIAFFINSAAHSYLISAGLLGIVMSISAGVIAGLVAGYYLLILFQVPELEKVRAIIRSRA